MDICVLGAGISGLSISKLLEDNHNLTIFEKSSQIGGIAKTKQVDNITFHQIGGHCFNSKHSDVKEFVFDKIMPLNDWHLVKRNAAIKFKKNEINYPIEFAIKEIFKFDEDCAINIVKDFLNSKDDFKYKNLDQWFRKKFGNTLSEEYFLPYNKKIWNKDPKEMDYAWVKDKLPVPNTLQFFKGLIESEEDKMPHSEFYYPNSNNQNTFIEKLSENLNIIFNRKIDSIFFDSKKQKWCLNNELYFDKIISTIPLNEVPQIIQNCPEEIIDAANNLKFNKISTMLWESKPTKRTWTYIPDPDIIFHRYIHIGNFFKPQKNYTITECVGEKSFLEMEENGKKDSFLLKALDHNISKQAYVVYDENHQTCKKKIFDYLDNIGIYTLGRFGQWDYFNMDICIKEAMKLKIIINESQI